MRYPYLIILLFAIACSNSEEQTQEVSENHLEQFNKNEKWIAGCKDNKSDTFINIFKEADGYVVENILGGERKRVSVAECIKLEESDLGSKSWQEIILFKNADANIDIKITIRGGQALTDPIITAVFGQYQGIVIKIDSTQVFAKYEKEHMLQQSNLKFSMLSCSNPNEETFPYYIEYKGENPSVKAEFHQFWLKFAEALLENDEETIIELTVFPFITPSPMDVWPDKVYETPWEFMIVLDEFLVWYVDAYLGTGNFSEYFYEYGISALKLRDEMAEKGSMRFHKIEGEWKLVSIYLEPATFTELENIIETYQVDVMTYESAYFYPDVSYISFVTTTNDSVDFYLEDTYIDSYDNEFFDVKEEEGSIFLVFVNKKGMQGTRYEIHTYAYIREVPQSDGEMEEYYRLKKFLKVEKE